MKIRIPRLKTRATVLLLLIILISALIAGAFVLTSKKAKTQENPWEKIKRVTPLTESERKQQIQVKPDTKKVENTITPTELTQGIKTYLNKEVAVRGFIITPEEGKFSVIDQSGSKRQAMKLKGDAATLASYTLPTAQKDGPVVDTPGVATEGKTITPVTVVGTLSTANTAAGQTPYYVLVVKSVSP